MTSKLKQTAAAAAAILAAGTLFTACGDNNSSDNSADTNSAGTGSSADTSSNGNTDGTISGTIKVLHHRTDRDQDGSMAELTKGFYALYPDVTVEYQSFTNYADDISTMMQSDNYGDVVMTPQALKQSDLPDFFESLGSFDELDKQFYWLKDYTVDGEVYGLPTGGTASGILYNKKVWSDAGIDALPTTPDEFISCLKKIAENTDAIPYYTNYNAGWTISQWQSLILSAAGDPEYNVKLLTDKQDLFYPDSPYDKVYGMLYEIYSDPILHEEDPMTTDWEGCKPAMAQGKIASMVMGSWAIVQFQEAAETAGADPADIGYMPFPNSIDGKIYSISSNDYMMSVNKNSQNKEAAKAYVKWFCTDSGYAEQEGMINGQRNAPMPESLSAFDELGVELFVEAAYPENLVGKFDEIAKSSEVDPWGDASTNFKFRLAEAAFKGGGREEYDSICADVNAAWNVKRDEML